MEEEYLYVITDTSTERIEGFAVGKNRIEALGVYFRENFYGKRIDGRITRKDIEGARLGARKVRLGTHKISLERKVLK